MRKRFGALEILKGIDLTLDKGGFLVLVGPSGCGKSTLLNTIAGLESISCGRDSHRGRWINDLHPSKRDIAMVFQSYALYPNMSVAREHGVRHGNARRAEGRTRQGRRRGRQDAADRASVSSAVRANFPAASASASRWGARWCASRASSCSTSRCPISTPSCASICGLRSSACTSRHGATIVYVTHDQIEAMTLATRIAVLKDGELQQVGTPHEIYNTPANLFVADFMGSPAMNLLEGRSRTINGDASGRPRARRTTSRSCFPLRRARTRASSATARKVIFGIRPEAVNDRESVDRNAKSVATFDGQVEIVEPAGSDTFVVTHIAGKEVTARMRADADVRVGESHAFAFNLDKAVLFDPATTRRI